MKVLGLSGVSLAAMITRYRDDGRITAPETISRWLNSGSPVEPAVLGWLSEMLRAKVMEKAPPFIEWPASNKLAIGVCSFDGGSDVTSTAQSLTAASHLDYRIKTLQFLVGKRGGRESMMQPMRGITDAHVVTPSGMLNFQQPTKSVVIADISLRVAMEAMSSIDSNKFLREFQPDLVVISGDLNSYLEFKEIQRFLAMESFQGKKRIVHRPNELNFGFLDNARRLGFDLESEILYPCMIPVNSDSGILPPESSFESYTAPSQQKYFHRLFRYLMSQAGGKIGLPHEQPFDFMQMDLAELLDRTEDYLLR
nr:hypothetical protein [uncultured Noviherbaspirillum sp.]